jgi:predicted transcriptional regulator
MNPRPVDRENPDRLYIVTGGRSRADEDALDLVTLIVSECEPAPGMQSEHVKILQMCRHPMAVVEISADLGLPVTVVKILLRDLLDAGSITLRHVSSAPTRTQPVDRETLEQVLIGLQDF